MFRATHLPGFNRTCQATVHSDIQDRSSCNRSQSEASVTTLYIVTSSAKTFKVELVTE